MMRRPSVLFFDVNETLLDLRTLRDAVGQVLGGGEEEAAGWFDGLLHLSLVATVAGQPRSFGELGVAALEMAARRRGRVLPPEAARAVLGGLTRLPAQPDAGPALARLRAAGCRLLALGNSAQAGLEAQLAHAGLAPFFERMLSVEAVGVFKPHPRVYGWAAAQAGVPPEDCVLVAAHGWDVAGALWAGWRAGFVARAGQVLVPFAPAPTWVAPELGAMADVLLAG